MMETFEYRTQGRRPGTYFALGVWMMLTYMAWTSGTHAVLWGLLAGFIVILGWWLAANPSSGMRLTDKDLEFFVGDRRWRVPLRDIDSVILTEGTGKKPGYKLHFINGATDHLPLAATPPAMQMERELKQRGIRLVSDAPAPLR